MYYILFIKERECIILRFLLMNTKKIAPAYTARAIKNQSHYIIQTTAP